MDFLVFFVLLGHSVHDVSVFIFVFQKYNL